MKETVLVLSDEHFGSPYGLMPTGFCDCDGQPIGQTPEQAYMWANFTKLLAAAAKNFPHLDHIIQNGDALDGKPNKAGDIETSIARSEDQVNLAIFGLKHVQDLWPGVPWNFTQGTKNHEKPQEVRQIAKAFGGKFHQTFTFNVGNLKVQANHESPGSSFATLEKQVSYSDRNTARFDFDRTHVFIRSHVHEPRALFVPGGAILTTPALQRPSTFMRAKEPDRACPQMGFFVLEFDDSGLELGRHGVFVTEFTWVLDEEVYRAA
jgi:hypothetical protein